MISNAKRHRDKESRQTSANACGTFQERLTFDTAVAAYAWTQTPHGTLLKLKAHSLLEINAHTLENEQSQLSLRIPRACVSSSAASSHQVIGLDEVGRGALMGPVVTAAVCFPEYPLPHEVQEVLILANDSKRLTAGQRHALYHSILTHAHVGIGWASAEEIDVWNIHRATLLGFYRALQHVWQTHNVPDRCSLLVDGVHGVPFEWFEASGNITPLVPKLIRQWTVVQGDQRSLSIACASIVAKHVRDTWVMALSGTSPLYTPFAWDKNKGYGSVTHREALAVHGSSMFHRKSFLKKLTVAQQQVDMQSPPSMLQAPLEGLGMGSLMPFQKETSYE
jgi:ribonuclease HII